MCKIILPPCFCTFVLVYDPALIMALTAKQLKTALAVWLAGCLALCVAGMPAQAWAVEGGSITSAASIASSVPAVAFYYGATPPWNELQAFDLAVVDPDHVTGALPVLPHTRVAAYVSVGEVQPSRAYAREIPAGWLVGLNAAWGSRLVDQAQPGWPAFFVDKIITPLWDQGYRDFFLDTLDSWHAIAKTPEQRAAQEAGLVAVIAAFKQRYPEARLIFNRGFEILERTRGQVSALAAESLYQGYDAANQSYRPVAEKDRAWLKAQLQRARDEFGLPVIVIDYVAAANRELARATAQRIEADGFIPWVSTGELDTLGVGRVEVMPRRVLLVHSPLANEYALRQNAVVRMATMPLNYLGYAAEYVDTQHLPQQPLSGRYAGIVVWLGDQTAEAEAQRLAAWLPKQVAEHLPVAIVGQLSLLLATPLKSTLGFESSAATARPATVAVIQRHAMLGMEHQPHPSVYEFFPLKLKNGTPLLTLSMEGQQQVAAGLAPWGGYVMSSSAVVTLANERDIRWIINPFDFFKAALRLPDMPVPDVTTESGRRMLMVHMDGDGFVSRSELRGNPYAGEVVRDRVVRKYPLPMTLSVIEAELSPQGLYPKLSSKLEGVAREIFRAPHVEIASHSYSHPFNWHKAGIELDAEEGNYNLPIPGYRFDLHREIEGSIQYINRRLAPPDKQVKLFLWTGDCIPGRDALEVTQRLGVLNMNGGDTTMTRSNPTLTRVEGLGVERQGLFQVFAPNQNENVYTHDWTAAYYGYERLIETFQLTEQPRRLKPMDIYFHTYITTKAAGMQSLDKVFSYALAQESTPVFASEYVRKVLEFPAIAIARSAQGWRVRGLKQVQTLRIPAALGVPDNARSRAVAGYSDHAESRYIHLAGRVDEAELALQPQATGDDRLRLVSANARIEDSQQEGDTHRWTLAGHVPLEFTLAHTDRCRIRVAGRELSPVRRDGAMNHYRITAHAARPLEAICAH